MSVFFNHVYYLIVNKISTKSVKRSVIQIVTSNFPKSCLLLRAVITSLKRNVSFFKQKIKNI